MNRRRERTAYHAHVSRIREASLRDVNTAQYHITMQRPRRQSVTVTTSVAPLPPFRTSHFISEQPLDIQQRIQNITRALRYDHIDQYLQEETNPCATIEDIVLHTTRVFYPDYVKESNNLQSNLQSDTCPICLQSYSNTDFVSILGCSHTFHSTCIERWLQTQKSNCALCRQSIFVNV